jgi:hypothetical protein
MGSSVEDEWVPTLATGTTVGPSAPGPLC